MRWPGTRRALTPVAMVIAETRIAEAMAAVAPVDRNVVGIDPARRRCRLWPGGDETNDQLGKPSGEDGDHKLRDRSPDRHRKARREHLGKGEEQPGKSEQRPGGEPGGCPHIPRRHPGGK